ncbi:hypothetical protein BC936DRAFT_146187 [Jimgerdemannia flammicorona]|uniref:Uncharacterized protein n=1 Tax=Jimgerdemannia flammicorona TaxID=994334 RepID=A0A433D899_9FUNG|nr:hypothetical protein BC936DRAFT_146187 [Jimgerdemannia flammicorona]
MTQSRKHGNIPDTYGTVHSTTQTEVTDCGTDSAQPLVAKPTPKPVYPYPQNPFPTYVLSALIVALAITLTASPNPTTWSTFLANLTLSHPERGEAGYGLFLIRGHHQTVAFAYAWRLINPTFWSRFTSWSGYVVHQLGQFYIVAQAQLAKRRGEISWAGTLNKYGWQMLQLNVLMVAYKLFQGHIWYDGTAQDLPDVVFSLGTYDLSLAALRLRICSSSSADTMPIFLASALATPSTITHRKRRSATSQASSTCSFSSGNRLFSSTPLTATTPGRPPLSAPSGCTGFSPPSFRAVTAGSSSPMASLLSSSSPSSGQRALGNKLFSVPAVLAIYAALVTLGFGLSGNLSRIFFVTFIPTSEYAYLVFYWLAFLACWNIVRGLERVGVLREDIDGRPRWAKVIVVVALYFAINLVVLIAYSVMLGGPLKIYNDYNNE